MRLLQTLANRSALGSRQPTDHPASIRWLVASKIVELPKKIWPKAPYACGWVLPCRARPRPRDERRRRWRIWGRSKEGHRSFRRSHQRPCGGSGSDRPICVRSGQAGSMLYRLHRKNTRHAAIIMGPTMVSWTCTLANLVFFIPDKTEQNHVRLLRGQSRVDAIQERSHRLLGRRGPNSR